MNEIIRPEIEGAINGVEGRFSNVIGDVEPNVICNQKWTTSRAMFYEGQHARITIEIRFDDECKNGQSTFSITGNIKRDGQKDWDTGGCIHDEIAKHFPELEPLIKWHLVSTDHPLHYVANATYFAGDKDYNGLGLGEEKPLLTGGRADAFNWRLVDTATGETFQPRDFVSTKDGKPPTDVPNLEWRMHMIVGKGKERELDAARRVAVWPEATDEQLCLPKTELTALLEQRLPALMASFRADMIACGFLWEAKQSQ